MKGQKLYIRPATDADAGAIALFYQSEGISSFPSSGEQLIGKLVGEIVAHLTFDVSEPSSLLIHHIYVAAGLRRKRVGRAMVEEVAAVARRSGRIRLAVRKGAEPAAFFDRLGFRPEDLRLEKSLTGAVR
jgi:GNAT superfamily N-acetyltransferase